MVVFIICNVSAFRQYDVNEDGYVSASDLKEAFARKGKKYPDEMIREWIRTRDLSGNGMVSFSDFIIHFNSLHK